MGCPSVGARQERTEEQSDQSSENQSPRVEIGCAAASRPEAVLYLPIERPSRNEQRFGPRATCIMLPAAAGIGGRRLFYVTSRRDA